MIKCPECGTLNDNAARFCNGCGSSLNMKIVMPVDDSSMSTRVHCPRCGGIHLQAVTESNTNVRTSGGGYSPTLGCLGYFLFGGWIGALLGIGGGRQKTTVNTVNKTYWVCQNCGNKFRNLDDWDAEIRTHERAKKLSFYMMAVFIILGLIILIAGSTIIGCVFLFIGIASGGSAAIYHFMIKNERNSFEELKRASLR